MDELDESHLDAHGRHEPPLAAMEEDPAHEVPQALEYLQPAQFPAPHAHARLRRLREVRASTTEHEVDLGPDRLSPLPIADLVDVRRTDSYARFARALGRRTARAKPASVRGSEGARQGDRMKSAARG